MQYIVSIIVSVLISLSMNTAVVDMVSTTPQQAVESTIKALEKQDSEKLEMYADNEYINFLNNVQVDKTSASSIHEALFKNFSYEIIDIRTKDDVAVAEVTFKTNDFSKINEKYEKAAYEYIINNLGTENVSDKEKLNAKCTEIYIQQIEKASEQEPEVETTVIVPVVSDGYYGWNVIIKDEMMKAVLGNFELPETDKK